MKLFLIFLAILASACCQNLRLIDGGDLTMGPLSIDEVRRYAQIRPVIDFRINAGKGKDISNPGIIPKSLWFIESSHF